MRKSQIGVTLVFEGVFRSYHYSPSCELRGKIETTQFCEIVSKIWLLPEMVFYNCDTFSCVNWVDGRQAPPQYRGNLFQEQWITSKQGFYNTVEPRLHDNS